ncbi:MAG: AAA family ATPase [Proteobacteria bacterium]|nr:AAA family ATPase [Pseudomonadota bacterium]
MRTLAVLSRKGGTGKTTIGLHLAVSAFHAGHRTLVCDLDPQRSALDWRRERQIAGPDVIEAKGGALFPLRQNAERSSVDLMVLDTRPASDADTSEAVRWADLCLIVVRPCFFDLKAIVRTVEQVTNMNQRGLFVLNQAPARRNGEEPRQIRDTVMALEELGLPIASTGLRYRAAYQTAVRQGLAAQEADPDSLAAFEMNTLWRQVSRELWPPVQKGRPTEAAKAAVRELTAA